ncbi:MAG: tetratricopeptide repeat protein, partial [Candidatus Binatia bacterium]
AYLAAGRLDEAEREARKLLTTDAMGDAGLALVARARAARGDATVEISRLQAELERREDSARLIETREVLAALLHAQRRDEEAVRVIEGAAYRSVNLRLLLAEIAESRSDLAEAAEHYARALSELTIDLTVGAKLADVYKRLGRFAESLELYDRVIGIKPEEAFLYVDRGAVRFMMGEHAYAAADYRKAISLDPRLPEAHLNLALAFLAEGNDVEAEKSLLRAVELRDDYAKAHRYLARLYRGRDDPRAERHAKRARSLETTSHHVDSSAARS